MSQGDGPPLGCHHEVGLRFTVSDQALDQMVSEEDCGGSGRKVGEESWRNGKEVRKVNEWQAQCE